MHPNTILGIRKEWDLKYSRLERSFVSGHIKPVMAFAVELAKHLGFEPGPYELGAYLHDVGLIEGEIEGHASKGAEIARSLLQGQSEIFPEELDLIGKMIAHHSGPLPEGLGIEFQILRCADAMAHIVNPDYTIHSFLDQGHDLANARRLTKEKILQGWEQKITIPHAKEMVASEYSAAIQFLINLEESSL